jgi:hypothetical protein
MTVDEFSNLISEIELNRHIDEITDKWRKIEIGTAFFEKDTEIFKNQKTQNFDECNKINMQLKRHDEQYGKLFSIDTDLKNAFKMNVTWSGQIMAISKKNDEFTESLIITMTKVLKEVNDTVKSTKDLIFTLQNQMKLAKEIIENREDELRNFIIMENPDKETLIDGLNEGLDIQEEPITPIIPTTTPEDEFNDDIPEEADNDYDEE